MLLEEHHYDLLVQIAILLLPEPMSFIRRQHVPDIIASLADGLDDLLGFRDRHAGIVLALGDEERRGNPVRVVVG